MDMNSELSKNIERHMRKRGWNPTELGRKSGVPQPTIKRILDGESADPRRSNVDKIGAALGVDSDDLYKSASEINIQNSTHKHATSINGDLLFTSIMEIEKSLEITGKVSLKAKASAIVDRYNCGEDCSLEDLIEIIKHVKPDSEKKTS